MRIFNKQLLIIFLLLVLTIPSLLPLFKHGFFVTDDGEWMIIRLTSFYQALHDGQFPVRFLQRLNFDYGYPVPTFLYPGFMYFGVLIHLLKVGFVDTIKIILGFSLVGTTIFTYLWLNKVFKNKLAAVVGAVSSLYVPYHLYDVYTRGSVGEVFALLWVPFILWMVERKNIFFLSIGIFLLIISHNTIALLFLPVIFIYAFFRKTIKLKKIFISFILGVLMSSFFTIPAILELGYTNFSNIKVSNPLNYFADLSLIGISSLIIFIVSGGLFNFQKKSQNEQDPSIRVFLLVTFIAMFFSSMLSGFVWHFIPSSLIQFPFRLLSYLIVSLSFITAFIITRVKNKKYKFIVIGVVLSLIGLSAYLYISPKTYMDKGDAFYSTNDATTTVKDEYMPKWVKEKSLQRPLTKIEIETTGKSSVTNLFYNNKKITFDLKLDRDSKVFINTLYWPGWKIYIDNKEDLFLYDNPKGVMSFNLSGGSHKVRAEFGETNLRLISDIISLLSFIIIIIFYFRYKDEKN